MCEQNRNISKEMEILRRYEQKILELKSTISKMKNSLPDSKADLSRQKKGSGNLNIRQWKLCCLRNRKKQFRVSCEVYRCAICLFPLHWGSGILFSLPMAPLCHLRVKNPETSGELSWDCLGSS